VTRLIRFSHFTLNTICFRATGVVLIRVEHRSIIKYACIAQHTEMLTKHLSIIVCFAV